MKKTIDKKPNYEIILSIVCLLLLGLWIFKVQAFLYAAVGVGILSLVSKRLAGYISWSWQHFLRGIGFINAHVILGLIFFLVLFPVSLLARMFNKNSIQLKREEQSYYKERNHTYVAGDLENPW